MHRHGIVSALVLAAVVAAAALSQGVGAQAPAPGTAPAQDTAKGAALLGEARKALGGEDKLAAIQRLEIRGEMRTNSGNLNIDGDSQVFFERPDKFKRKDELSLGAGGPSIERLQILTSTEFIEETSQGGMPGRGGFDGGGRRGGGFRGGNFGGNAGGQPGGQQGGQQQGQAQVDPERLREAQRRNLQTEVSRMLLAVLLATDSASTVAWVGTAQSPDGTADVLEVTTPNAPVTRLLLDTTTHMPLMLTWTGGGGGALAGRAGNFGRGRFGGDAGGDAAARGGDGGRRGDAAGAPPAGAGAPDAQAAQGRRGGRGGGAATTTQMFLADYKVVNGVKLPHLITRGSNGETAEELEIKNYRINPNFRADTFTK